VSPMPEPRSPDAERLRRAVRRWAGDALMRYREHPPAYLWLFGSALIQAALDGGGAIELSAVLLLAPERDRLAGMSPVVEGRPALRVDHEGDLVFERRLPAGLGLERLEDELARFCREADRLADRFHVRCGGQRAVDRFEQEVLGLLGLELSAAGPPN